MEIKKTALLEKAEEISVVIPKDLVSEFDEELRIVIRHPWIIGIPAPEALIKSELIRKSEMFDVMLVPKYM